MNLELIARLNQDRLDDLRREAAKGIPAREGLRLPRVAGGTSLAQRILSLLAPGTAECCPSLS